VTLRFLLGPPLDGARNMALDEALLAHARATGTTVVRVYGWAAPTLSFGRNQRAIGLYDGAALAARGLDVVRRPTGGRAVLHWREATYSVAAPLGALAPTGAPLKAAYARINGVLLAALRALGVDAREAVPVGRSPLPDGAPCFEVPTGGELVLDTPAGARKLVGSAQWQDEGALLQHGSILVDDDQTRVGALATRPLPPVPPPATLRQALGRAPGLEEVAAALFDAARAQLDPGAAPLDDATAAAVHEAAEARASHYRDDAWTWRR
jgi:lipoate-protein ligase A